MRKLLLAAALLVLMAPAGADAASRNLWATVNVCDPPSARNVIGIRASMPGNGTGQRMHMHFTAEWYSPSEKRWRATGSASPWVRVGSARHVSAQAGYSFQFADPPRDTRFLMRGVVRYQWRARGSGRVLRRATRVTKGGYEGVLGGIPDGRSDRTCLIVH